MLKENVMRPKIYINIPTRPSYIDYYNMGNLINIIIVVLVEKFSSCRQL